jgi:hypothetical protein
LNPSLLSIVEAKWTRGVKGVQRETFVAESAALSLVSALLHESVEATFRPKAGSRGTAFYALHDSAGVRVRDVRVYFRSGHVVSLGEYV